MSALVKPLFYPLTLKWLESTWPWYLLLTLWPLSASTAALQLALPRHRLQADELAVIVNDADALSVRIGTYYVKARHLPAKNLLHVRFKPGRKVLGKGEFTRLKQRIDAITPANIQAYALTWAAPYRVGCMSITSALTFGFDPDWCSRRRCAPTRDSPLFEYRGSRPYDDLGIRPSMSIAATNFARAQQLIDRSIAADGRQPTGKAYLVSTHDRARNVRAAFFPAIVRAMQGWLETTIVSTDALQNRDDVLFYFTGSVRVPYLDTLSFVPGAVADHLTSTGGQLIGSRQMSALRWLEAGASGSYGTVVEPCNLPGKFPNPGLLMESYGSGRTLIEAYWQSVQQPGEGIFIGDPLTAPFDGYRIEVKNHHLLLQTRTLLPGIYRLDYATSPVGPYHSLGLLAVAYHQQVFELPAADKSYYRLSKKGS